MGQHVRLLRAGETIFKPVYNHSNGMFDTPEFVTPKPIVLINGLHGLYTPELRRQWDVSVFLDPHPTLRIEWKIKRDTSKRGYTRDQVLKELEARRHDSETYVMPQRDLADIVISFYPPADYERTLDDTTLNCRITLRHPIPLPDLEDAFSMAGRTNGDGELRLVRGTDGADLLEVSGRLSSAATEKIENRMWDHMATARHLRSDRLGVFLDGQTARHSNSLAITQLVLTYYLVKASALVIKQEQRQADVALSPAPAAPPPPVHVRAPSGTATYFG
jgi:phosphoribulokinase